MSSHITTTYVEHVVGTAVLSGLIDSTALATLILAASAKVDMALTNAGYPIPTSANDSVQLATMGALLPVLYGRKGLSVPEEFLAEVRLWQGIATGEVALPNMEPSVRAAVGGHTWSDQSDTSSNGRPPVFYGKLRSVF